MVEMIGINIDAKENAEIVIYSSLLSVITVLLLMYIFPQVKEALVESILIFFAIWSVTLFALKTKLIDWMKSTLLNDEEFLGKISKKLKKKSR